jgi:antitoxin (DNA-binding transcriptional repressor) of toxin-antitoxin stability system
MKKASIRDLHMRTGALVQQAADGEVIVVEKRGVAVAELRPIKRRTTAEVFRERELSGYFKKLPKTNGELSRYISEDRDR